MWIFLFLLLSFSPSSSPDVAIDREDIRCFSSKECGQGDCWRGYCENTGYCVAYWTCA